MCQLSNKAIRATGWQVKLTFLPAVFKTWRLKKHLFGSGWAGDEGRDEDTCPLADHSFVHSEWQLLQNPGWPTQIKGDGHKVLWGGQGQLGEGDTTSRSLFRRFQRREIQSKAVIFQHTLVIQSTSDLDLLDSARNWGLRDRFSLYNLESWH